MKNMKKWLFQTQDSIGFLLGILSGFGINLVTGNLSNIFLGVGIVLIISGIGGFFAHKKYVSTVDEFDFYITHSFWEKKTFNNIETWICKDTDRYQLVEGNSIVKEFKEPWTEIFPDNSDNESCNLILKRNGIIVQIFTWVSCDGGRVFMPIPDSKILSGNSDSDDQREFSFQKNSLKYKMLEKIGNCGSETSFERLLERAQIKVY